MVEGEPAVVLLEPKFEFELELTPIMVELPDDPLDGILSNLPVEVTGDMLALPASPVSL